MLMKHLGPENLELFFRAKPMKYLQTPGLHEYLFQIHAEMLCKLLAKNLIKASGMR